MRPFWFVFQEKCDNMVEYIKRLKLCIKWFQELEYGYLLEQKKLQDELESSEVKCSEMGIFRISCSSRVMILSAHFS